MAIARVGVFRPRPEARRGRRRGRGVRERVQAPRLARRAAARIHQRSGDVRAPLLPPVEVREVRVVVDVVPRFRFVNERGRQDLLPERPEPLKGGAAGDGPASPRPRGSDGTARPRDGLGRGGEQTVLREAQLRVRRGRKRERRLRGGRRNNSASSPLARRGGGRRVRLQVAHMTRRVKRVVSSESFRFLSAQTFSRLFFPRSRSDEQRSVSGTRSVCVSSCGSSCGSSKGMEGTSGSASANELTFVRVSRLVPATRGYSSSERRSILSEGVCVWREHFTSSGNSVSGTRRV